MSKLNYELERARLLSKVEDDVTTRLSGGNAGHACDNDDNCIGKCLCMTASGCTEMGGDRCPSGDDECAQGHVCCCFIEDDCGN